MGSPLFNERALGNHFNMALDTVDDDDDDDDDFIYPHPSLLL